MNEEEKLCISLSENGIEQIDNDKDCINKCFQKVYDPKILSSCYINCFFGAGVNGSAFPVLSGFCETLEFIKKKNKNPNLSFEELFNELPSKNKETARILFVKEFNKKINSINQDSVSISHIKELFRVIYKLVYESENRIKAMKQVNVFTTNYDFIVEDSIKSLGYLCNYVSASNLDNHDKMFNIVGHDYSLKKDIPTFLVSKIHGDISDPVLPGVDKYDSVLTANKFEIIFKMKEKLMRENSVLFVIGYSGKDKHINSILKDCIEAGLLVYWYKYTESDYVPKEFETKITRIIENESDNDTTVLLTKHLRELWVKSSEE